MSPRDRRGTLLRATVMGLGLLLTSCVVDPDPAAVRCFDDSHCPSDWRCLIPEDQPTGLCEAGDSPAGDDDVAIDPLDVDDDGDGHTENGGDCDDADETRFPGNVESCNGEDDDCVGGPDFSGEGVDLDADGSPACEDCADEDDTRYPGQSELCDSVDSDCDGDVVDEELDSNTDGEPDCTDTNDDGDLDPDATDCAPLDPTVFAGAVEVCDEIDSDCDGSLVDEFPDLDADDDPDCTDLDADGDGSLQIDDCDDLDVERYPGATELCDALDQDCDGDLLEAFADLDLDLDPNCTDPDADGDGSLSADDCDDLDAAIHTGAPESCDNLDSNCDLSLVDSFSDTDADLNPDCLDLDDDGDFSPDVLDCAALDPSIYPNASEACDNVDGDCDLSLVDGFADLDGDGEPDCVDSDDDGDGDEETSDCDDGEATIHTGASEACDWIDADCDLSVVDEFANLDGDAEPDCIDGDTDGDGVDALEDCDDLDPLSTTVAYDFDCDGVIDGPIVETQQGIDFVLVPAGTFTMGCVSGRDDVAGGCFSTESPSHAVTLTHSMWVMETEVTQAEFTSRMGYSPSYFSGCPTCPVEQVNWHEAAAFANSLSASAALTSCYNCTGNTTSVTCSPISGSPYVCTGYRLPTEAEWEYAARGGEDFPYAGSDVAGDVAWYSANSSSMPHPAAQKLPNGFGLYDLAGNVWELSGDFWDVSANYPSTAQSDPYSAFGGNRVIRGGGWINDAQYVRVAHRYFSNPANRNPDVGFRVLRSIPSGDDADGDLDPDPTDCNDADALIYTGAPESCDAADSDCDSSLIDGFANFDGDLQPDCIDLDDDNDADPDATDCNDANSSVFNGGNELCDSLDSDCDGSLIDGFANTDLDTQPNCVDLDDDGDGDADASDCDDDSTAIYTNAPETCDGIDSDCDGSLIDGFANSDTDGNPDCIDLDDDNDLDPDATDCNDSNAAIYTGATELCDAVDSDCDLSLIDGFANTDGDSQPNCVDLDDDGDGDADVSDCDDDSSAIYTGAPESCDAVDSDCDLSLVDTFANSDTDGNPDCIDLDDDNDLDPDVSDCNDSNAAIYTGATELCDAIDSDCDLSLIDGFANLDGDPLPDCSDPDADGDGTDAADDCDDLDPLSTIVAEDFDCDGVIDGPIVQTQQGIDFVLVPAGSFTMGCVTGRDEVAGGCISWESPSHAVTLTHSMWVMEAEVTQAEFTSKMGYSPSHFTGCPTCPVERVNWYEAAAFANSLSASAGLTSCYSCTGSTTSVSCSPISGSPYVCTGYRLPTEAEWEYAGRGGEDFPFAGSSVVGDVAWYNANSSSMTHPGAQKLPNGFGLYDLSGNVWEWGGDFWDGSVNYPSAAQSDPYSASGSYRVGRGGSWSYSAGDARVAIRNGYTPGYVNNNFGFRLARTVP